MKSPNGGIMEWYGKTQWDEVLELYGISRNGLDDKGRELRIGGWGRSTYTCEHCRCPKQPSFGRCCVSHNRPTPDSPEHDYCENVPTVALLLEQMGCRP